MVFKFGKLPPLDWREATIPKKSGGVRLLEIPNDDLKLEQRRILRYLYDLRRQGLLPISQVAHGFVPFRSTLTAITHHDLQSRVFVCLDIHDFFPNFPVDRTLGVIRGAGVNGLTIDYIKRCCTYKGRFNRDHFPQGSPTSPFLTNIGMIDVDCMISAYARRNGFHYTRYADDIQLSALPGTETTERYMELTKNKSYPFMDIFFGIETILKDHLGLELKHTKDHVIWRWSLCKPQILGVILRADNFGYNAPKKKRRCARAGVFNLFKKLESQNWHPFDEDILKWQHLSGLIDYMDYVRSFSPFESAATADPIIQENKFLRLQEIFDGRRVLQAAT